ncbi:MAG: stage III sporulation protein AB [Defluviitaleaceae bacterium]|nr:stage III sporulation protein AB [Defluviitaleaceae bacterium]
MQIAGAILIILTSYIIGYYLGSFPINRKMDLLQFKKALSILSSEIEHMHTPLKTALINIAERLNKPIDAIFINFANFLETEMPKDAFQKSLQLNIKKTYLTKEDIYILNNFASIIGHLDIAMQKSAINLLNEQLTTAINECTEIGAKNKKLYTSLSVLFGLLIVVILF